MNSLTLELPASTGREIETIYSSLLYSTEAKEMRGKTELYSRALWRSVYSVTSYDVAAKVGEVVSFFSHTEKETVKGTILSKKLVTVGRALKADYTVEVIL